MKKTGAQLILEVLLEHGVDTVFGYPGGAALNVYDALYEYQDRIKHILTAHEQGASHAADGYARATGKTGGVFATRSFPCCGWICAFHRQSRCVSGYFRTGCNKSGNRDCNSLYGQRSHGCHYQQCDK